MKTKIIEATNNNVNWGKFMLGQFTEDEWQYRSQMALSHLLHTIGWSRAHLWVLDLQTGEGAFFRAHHWGFPRQDLEKHRIHVCPLYEPFLAWLYKQAPTDVGELLDLDALPALVNLPEAEAALFGYRRPGITPREP